MKKTIYTSKLIMAAAIVCTFVYSCKNSATTEKSATDSASVSTSANDVTVNNSLPKADTAVAGEATLPKLSGDDEDFMLEALETSMTENQLLRAAMAKSSNDMIKQNAPQMLADNDKLDKQLTDYAAKRSMRLSVADTAADMSALNDKTDKAWDKAWADMLLSNHKEMIEDFKGAQTALADSGLKMIVADNMPALNSHLSMLQSIKQNSMKR